MKRDECLIGGVRIEGALARRYEGVVGRRGGPRLRAALSAVRWERLEGRLLRCAEHAGQRFGGLTADELNALPANSPVPFDLHADAPAPPPLDVAPPPATSTTILNNGPSANRVDIVLVGDGYTSAQLGTYATQAQSFLSSFFAEAPFNRYASYFNVHRVDVVSNESGVDNDPTNGTLRDTALDAGYWCNGIQRLICMNTTKARSYAVNAPQVDQTVALINSTTYGGAGYPSADMVTYAGGNGSSLEIARHEFGHSFGDLADEYDYADGTTYTGGEPSDKNTTILSSASAMTAAQKKWYRWLDLANVDVFQGAAYTQYGVYRPTNNSKMRNLNRPFEEVNVEQLILKMYATVKPIDSATPAGTYQTSTSTFTVDPVDPSGTPLSVQWYLDGAPVAGATGTTFNSAAYGLSGNHVLKVVVRDDTTAVRDESARAALMTEERSWTLADTLAPVVATSQYNAAGRPPAAVVSFNEPVGSTVAASDLKVVNLTSGQTVAGGSVAVQYAVGTNVATFTFPGYANGMLPDGNYRATLQAGSVADTAGNSLAADHTLDFFVLAGDLNRDRAVGFDDFNALAAHYGQSGQTLATGDVDGDGAVGFADFNLLAANYGRTLPPPPAPVAPAPVVPAFAAPSPAPTVPATPSSANPTFATAATIPFNSAAAGYGKDAYAVRANGLTYGWRLNGRAAVGRTWELAVPAGTYLVRVQAGSAAAGSASDVRVEGRPLFGGQRLAPGRFVERQVTMTVKDGKLTLDLADSRGVPTFLSRVRIARA